MTRYMRILPLLHSVLIGIPVGITLSDRIGSIARVQGISMQPTLNPNLNESDYVFLNHWSIRNYSVRHGEIVTIISPKDPSQTLIKRVVGLAGDIVRPRNKTDILLVPKGHCWVEGDHADHSADSNTFGPVSVGLITGKAMCIVWPPSRWQYLYPSMENHNVLNLKML